MFFPRRFLGLLVVLGTACGDGAPPATTARYDLDADLGARKSFLDLPFPADLRLRADGTPDLTGYPIRTGSELFENILSVAQTRPAWPVMPVAYFRFDGPLAPRDVGQVLLGDPASPILLVDLETNALLPTVAKTLAVDDYAPAHTLAVAPRPGVVLHPGRPYAFVVRRGANDAAGEPLGVPAALAELAAGRTPPGAHAAAAAADLAPLWRALDALGVPRGDVAVATVFTTGDVVAETKRLSDGLIAKHDAQIHVDALAPDPDDGAAHARFCELKTTITMPNFQKGVEPYDTEGRFELGADDLPVLQKTLELPMVLTLPVGEMPAGGYPLVVYFHGSGGLHDQVVDRGRITVPGGVETKAEGPSHVLAPHGFATAGTALPVNPERVPGATEIAYLNFANLAAFPYLFREGVIEQRLFLDALLALEIPPAALGACAGVTLPAGETAFRFDPAAVFAMGQSMGGMYTNMVGAVEGRFRALVPTGAGGYWPYMILQAAGYADFLGFLPVVLDTNAELSFVHPGMHLLELAWEPAEPLAHMARLSRRPLPGVPPRSVYEPVGFGDSDFGPELYDAVALAYGHEQAGSEVWPSMQAALALAGLGGLLPYPVVENLVSESGEPYTGVVVQYMGDGIADPHYIFSQLDDVKYQYGCFLESAWRRGKAVLPAPAPLGTPCPAP
jgi:hypothetical protein